MAIITLTSDWGYRDHYIGAVKGRLLSLIPDATIVDITHAIDHFNSSHAAFVVKNAFQSFPEGTIHIIGVNSIAGIHSPHTIVRHKGHYFIGADNGILTLICGKETDEIIEIDITSDTDYFIFPSRDTFPRVAAHILSGKPISEIGTPRKELSSLMAFEPIVNDEYIRGKIIHRDHYNNGISNISEQVFRSFTKGRKFRIRFRGHTISTLSNSYDDVPEGEALALISTTGYLQIAIHKGDAYNLLGFSFDESVTITREA
jgi:S-adenosyl-L-methionine hydrolase (adenosine-forming)